MKKLLRIFLYIFFFLLLVVLLVFDTVDDTHYKEATYYHEMMERLEALEIPEGEKSIINIGWAKENITPDFSVSLASYGRKDPFEGVHDSIWVRAFVFNNGQRKAALVTMDLLVVPPAVVRKVEAEIKSKGFNPEDIYYSATHTHNSAGGWIESFAGKYIAGPYEEKIVTTVSDAVVRAILIAEQNAEPAVTGAIQEEAAWCVNNRLVFDKGSTDPYLRGMIIKKKSGSTAVLSVFSAHANCITHQENVISCDYPGVLVRELEKNKDIDFAAFCAGAVGSMGPGAPGYESYEKAEMMGEQLSERIIRSMEKMSMKDSLDLHQFNLPVSLRSPHLRITEGIRFRPWVFRVLLGAHYPEISFLKIGNIVFIGTPCDYSGELVQELDEEAASKKINLIITSFNGGYIGYITPDKYYQLKKGETQEMNWFGPYNGAYFTEIIRRILQKI